MDVNIATTAVEYYILSIFSDEYFVSVDTACPEGMPEKVFKAWVRSLLNREMLHLTHGYSDDGLIYGSGYVVTNQGRSYRNAMEKKLKDYGNNVQIEG